MTRAVAIDGPAGAGKSTIAKRVAQDLGYHYVDTGALYRAVAVLAIDREWRVESEEWSEELARSEINVEYEDNGQHVYVDGFDVTGRLRTPEVSLLSSNVARLGFVRDRILQIERDIAERYDVVMDGRDIGTCVLPNALVKIYLTASAGVRAERRYKELVTKNMLTDSVSQESILQEIIDRDRRDMTREIAPLRQANDAVLLDTSDMDIDTAVAAVEAIIARSM